MREGKYTQEELKIIKEMVKYSTIKEISIELNRSVSGVKHKVKGMKLKAKSQNNSTYAYEVGEIVNDSLRVLEQVRIPNGKGRTQKGYLVQSITYPTAPFYEVDEYYLKQGKGDQYLKRRVFEGNSLYSVKHIRCNLVDKTEAKNTHRTSKNYIKVICDNCGKEKNMRAEHLVRHGVMCQNCSKGTSYPELFFMAYNEQLGLGFLSQQVFNDFPNHIFDFVDYENRVIVETHGIAHYEESGWVDAHRKSVESDKRKRKYCKENNWTLIELDCSISSFEHIRNSIKNEPLLEDVTDEYVEGMLELMELNKRYDVKSFVEGYKKGMTIRQLSSQYKTPRTTVNRILVKNNVELRPTGGVKGVKAWNRLQVRCINTGEVFDTCSEAKEWALNGSKVNEVCKGNRKSAGKHPITGEKLRWEYVD